MFQQTFSNFPQRKTISFKTSDSKSIIRIEKTKLLPYNFFKPLAIQVLQTNPNDQTEPIVATPCFGSQSNQIQQFQLSRPYQVNQRNDKEEFHTWFLKGKKPHSSRVQTLPVQKVTSKEKKRHLSSRKTRLQRVNSVQQEGCKSNMKIFKKFQHLIGDKLQTIKPQSHFKFKIKPEPVQEVQKSYKNHFKINSIKRGYTEAKYKQNKALRSINQKKQGFSFLPSINNG